MELPGVPTSIEMPVPDYSASLNQSIKGLRIGVPTNFFFDTDEVIPEVTETVKATLAVFAALGAEVKEVTFPNIDAFGVNDAFLADAAAYHEDHLRDQPEAFSKVIGDRLANTAKTFRAVDYSRDRLASSSSSSPCASSSATSTSWSHPPRQSWRLPLKTPHHSGL